MSTNLQDFLPGYLAEADEHLAAATVHLVALEDKARRGEGDPRSVRELFRALHTLKGLSAMIGVDPVVDLAHEMEAVFRTTDRTAGKLSVKAVDLLLRALKAIEERVRALADQRPVLPAPVELVEALARLELEPGGADMVAALALPPEIATKLSASEVAQLLESGGQGRRAVRLDFAPSAVRAASGLSISSVRERLATVADVVKVVPMSQAVLGDNPTGLVFVLLLVSGRSPAELAQAAGLEPALFVDITAAPPITLDARDVGDDDEASERGARLDVVRVEVGRLDEMLDRLSALIVNRFALSRSVAALAERGVDVREVRAVMAENGRALRDLRSSIMRARLVPMAEVLARVPLVVRGAAKATHKRVKVDVRAGSTELDKAVAERVFPALVHLLRNAVDHGIEAPDVRRAAGKPQDGLIEVRCSSTGSDQVELTFRDDGRGIDAAKVAARTGAPMPKDEAELLELVCRPGLSTSTSTTQTSGRGIGMDIVRRVVVDELGGQLSLTTSSSGTTFTVRVPLTIAIIDAFSLTCSLQTFVVPVSTVEDIVEIDAAAVVIGPAPGNARDAVRMLRRRGRTIPLYSLAQLLGLPAEAAPRQQAIIVGAGGAVLAFDIGRMLGQQEVVVRPLQDALVRTRGVAGTTDLGDGKPVLVLDLVALGAAALRAA